MDVQLPKLTDDQALAILLSFLKGERRANADPMSSTGDDVFIPNIIWSYLTSEQSTRASSQVNQGGMSRTTFDTNINSGPFYAAAAILCQRGILYPSWQSLRDPASRNPVIGAGFMVSDYGRRWLSGLGNHATPPTENVAFIRLLDSHASRLGDGYRVRSREALACYQATTYLACCAMCGSAAESILLKLAITKTGDEAQVMKEYRAARGRQNLENILRSQQNKHIQDELAQFLSLLKYWRDEAAHGTVSPIGEEEAFLALLLLLRLARFADERWNELTHP